MEKFASKKPTCVQFDDKLQFYTNLVTEVSLPNKSTNSILCDTFADNTAFFMLTRRGITTYSFPFDVLHLLGMDIESSSFQTTNSFVQTI